VAAVCCCLWAVGCSIPLVNCRASLSVLGSWFSAIGCGVCCQLSLMTLLAIAQFLHCRCLALIVIFGDLSDGVGHEDIRKMV
jgi:hypothetical protein